MRIAFYPPFKPLDHPNPSGDLVIATGLVDHLQKTGHEVIPVSRLRARWIYWKPWLLARALAERVSIARKLKKQTADLWLTYHSYYKAPDLLGPAVSQTCQLPYVIFQGIFSTRVSKKWQTSPGYKLNRKALLAADLVLTNRRDDLTNLLRLLPEDRVRYLAPGIHPTQFSADPDSRLAVQKKWQEEGVPVILSAAMFRPDVKTEGLQWVIQSCARLLARGHDLRLVIAGDGQTKPLLVSLAHSLLGDKVHFAGRIPREKMAGFYSGGDLFAFPGINESLGMVFLEAQSCGLPVVAFKTAGVPEVVRDGVTGLLSPPMEEAPFDRAIQTLLDNPEKRVQMGNAAATHIRRAHDLQHNYGQLEQLLQEVVDTHRERGAKHAA